MQAGGTIEPLIQHSASDCFRLLVLKLLNEKVSGCDLSFDHSNASYEAFDDFLYCKYFFTNQSPTTWF